MESNFLFPLLRGACEILIQSGKRVFVPTMFERIGHLAGEVDLWLKESILAGGPEKQFALILGDDVSANPHLTHYFRQRFHWIIPPETWKAIAAALPDVSPLVVKRDDYYVAINQTATCFPIYEQWGGRGPLFRLSETDRFHLQSALIEFGIPVDAWYVCLHNRECGYSKWDDNLHNYRNAAIEDYFAAIEEITSRGGWVIRMGDSSMKPLPRMPQVIDYVHSPLRSSRLDVCLCSSARFFLGTTSGLFILAMIFGVPCCLANLAPMCMAAFTKDDIGIPKRYAGPDGQAFPLPAVMNSPLSNFRFSELYQRNKIQVIDNTPEEIQGMVVEMIERLEGRASYTEDDEDLQRRYRALFRQGHYSYRSPARTGRHFLRTHRAEL
jgi:putative glycosyltransferase (TIGR04372 family)